MSRPSHSETAYATDDGTATAGFAGAGMRRLLLLATATLAVLLVGAAVALACTTYKGVTIIENLDRGAGELKVVANKDAGMDRCEDATNYDAPDSDSDDNDDNIIAYNDGGDNSDKGADTIRVEIDEYTGTDCSNSSMAGHGKVNVNVFDGAAYDDTETGNEDGRYEDYDCDLFSCDSTERVGDCMDSSNSDVIKKNDTAIGVNGSGQLKESHSEVTNNDTDDDIPEFDLTLDETGDSTNHDNDTDSNDSGVPDETEAICVAQDGSIDYSAPQIPIVIK